MSVDADTAQFVEDCIGPRAPGVRYLNHYWGDIVTVLAVDRDPADHHLWTVTEANEQESRAGTSRTHCTPWDDRDRVVS